MIRTDPTSAAPAGPVLAIALDGRGGGRAIDAAEPTAATSPREPRWLELDPTAPWTAAWLAGRPELGAPDRAALVGGDRRPQLRRTRAGVIATFHWLVGAPERRATIALWLEGDRLVSLASDPLPGRAAIERDLAAGTGPVDAGALFARLAAAAVAALCDQAELLEPTMAELEYDAETGAARLSDRLHGLTRRVSRLRRHVAPLKLLLARTHAGRAAPGRHVDREPWRAMADEAEDADGLLQSLGERGRALHDLVGERQAERMNVVLYRLTLLSAIMMPLTLITGLFGMNVGIADASYHWMEGTSAFLAVTGALVAIAWAEYRVMRRRDLLVPPPPRRRSPSRP